MNTTKLSHYVIATEPLAKADGKRLVYSTRSGKTLVVPELCYDYLLSDRIDEIPSSVVKRLFDSQILVPVEEDELSVILDENKKYIDEAGDEQLYIVIQPSASCQLGCYYCGQQHSKDYVSAELYEKIEARISSKLATGNYKGLFIGWFGAEPLMGLSQIRELTERFKALARQYRVGYGAKMVTNGLSLKEKIFEELATKLSIRSIEVTLDGPAEYHDSHRYTKEGGKSFDLIFRNLQTILNRPDLSELNCPISIRCNVDEKNYMAVSDLIRLLAEAGIHKKISHFYAIGVYSWGNDAHKKSLTKEGFAKLEMGWLAEQIMAGYDISLMPGRIEQVCMSVAKSAEMYDAFGNVSNCTEVSYVPAYKDSDYFFGHLNDEPNTFKSRNVISDWNNTLQTDVFPCHTCKMLPVCGGGCPKSWHEDMRACPSPKFNIQDRLELVHLLSKTDPSEAKDPLEAFALEYNAKNLIM